VNSGQCGVPTPLACFITPSDRLGRSWSRLRLEVDSDCLRGFATWVFGTALPLPYCARFALAEGGGRGKRLRM
jgi:hypothetical protein